MGSGGKVAASVQRIREILCEATGGNSDAFCRLPLREPSPKKLLQAKLHDILPVVARFRRRPKGNIPTADVRLTLQSFISVAELSASAGTAHRSLAMHF